MVNVKNRCHPQSLDFVQLDSPPSYHAILGAMGRVKDFKTINVHEWEECTICDYWAATENIFTSLKHLLYSIHGKKSSQRNGLSL